MADIRLLTIHSDCDASVRKAVLHLKEAVEASTRYHSTESVPYSIWSLVAEHMDQPVSAFLSSWIPSRPFLPRPPALFDPDGFSASLKRSFFDVENKLIAAIRLVNACWDTDLHGGKIVGGHAEVTLCATLETLSSVAFFCASQLPKQRRDPVAGRTKFARKARQYRGAYYPLMHYPFCELCGDYCEHAESPTVVPRRGHDRYCARHSDKSNTTKGEDYRTAHNHRERFHRELYYFYRESRESQLIRLGVPVIREPHIARELAYELVRANISPRHETILLRHWAKVPQAAIARELGISRQAVSTAIKRLVKSPKPVIYWIHRLATTPVDVPPILQAAMNDPVARHCISATQDDWFVSISLPKTATA